MTTDRQRRDRTLVALLEVGVGCALIAAFFLPWVRFGDPLVCSYPGHCHDYSWATDGFPHTASAMLANIGAGAAPILGVYGLVWSRRWMVGLLMAAFLAAIIGAVLGTDATPRQNPFFTEIFQPLVGTWVFLGVVSAGVLLSAFDLWRWSLGTMPSRYIATSPHRLLLGIAGVSVGVGAVITMLPYATSDGWDWVSPDVLGGLVVGVLVFFGLVGLILADRALRSSASPGGEPPIQRV